MPKAKTKAEKIYTAKVALLPCYVWANHPEYRKECGGKGEIHHKTGAGMAKRASHYDVVKLCFNHHSSQTPLGFGCSIHKGKRTFEAKIATQDVMIAWTKQQVEESNYE